LARSVPFIPYLPVHLRDLTFLEDLPDNISDPISGVVLVNLEKMKRLYSAITLTLSHQNTFEQPTGEMKGSGFVLCKQYLNSVILLERSEDELVEMSGKIRPYPILLE
jgi:hypothetical protein